MFLFLTVKSSVSKPSVRNILRAFLKTYSVACFLGLPQMPSIITITQNSIFGMIDKVCVRTSERTMPTFLRPMKAYDSATILFGERLVGWIKLYPFSLNFPTYSHAYLSPPLYLSLIFCQTQTDGDSILIASDSSSL